MHKLPLVTLKLRGGFFIASNTFPLPAVAGFLFESWILSGSDFH